MTFAIRQLKWDSENYAQTAFGCYVTLCSPNNWRLVFDSSFGTPNGDVLAKGSCNSLFEARVAARAAAQIDFECRIRQEIEEMPNDSLYTRIVSLEAELTALRAERTALLTTDAYLVELLAEKGERVAGPAAPTDTPVVAPAAGP